MHFEMEALVDVAVVVEISMHQNCKGIRIPEGFVLHVFCARTLSTFQLYLISAIPYPIRMYIPYLFRTSNDD